MIKLTKLKEVENPRYKTASSVEEYRSSLLDGENLSPSVDYWVIGEPLNELKVGDRFLISRINRNGVECFGLMTTSTVQKITENGFETMNSVYLIEEYVG